MSHSENYRDTGPTTIYYDGFEAGQEKIIQLLKEKKALRASFFLDGLVLYTEDGPIDITEAELKGKSDL